MFGFGRDCSCVCLLDGLVAWLCDLLCVCVVVRLFARVFNGLLDCARVIGYMLIWLLVCGIDCVRACLFDG